MSITKFVCRHQFKNENANVMYSNTHENYDDHANTNDSNENTNNKLKTQ